MINKLKLTIVVLAMLVVLGFGCVQKGSTTLSGAVTESEWTLSEARVIYEGDPDGQRYRVLPRIVRLLDGTLIAQMERGSHERRPIFIRSTDGAKTWSKPYTGVMAEEINVVSHMGVMLDGRMVAVSGGDISRLAYSSDQGKTWVAGNKIDYSPMIRPAAGEGRVLQLDDGTILIPLFGYLPEVRNKLSAAVVRSSDNGATWSLSVVGRAKANEPVYYSETTIAKMNDGTLVALLRPGLARSVSTDGGKTWSSPVATGLKGTHCGMTQLDDGTLLSGYHRPPQLSLSTDGGITWPTNILWKMEEPLANWGWYTDVEAVNENTAVALIKDIPRSHIVRSCLLRRQPTAEAKDQQPWKKPGSRAGEEIVGPDGGTLVWVPGGKFMMGSNDGEIDEKPVHEVQLDGFWIGKFEVSNALYRDYWREKGRTFRPDNSRGENHPVVYVTWQDVVDYCKHYGLSLPTEAQWEYAARGPQSLRYPWGNEWDTLKCCHDDNRGPGDRTFRVGTFPQGASWCGALDMVGNVWEWCADWYGQDYYKKAPSKNPQGPKNGIAHVLRGNSWWSHVNANRPAGRYYLKPDKRLEGWSDWASRYCGFRVVVNPR